MISIFRLSHLCLLLSRLNRKFLLWLVLSKSVLQLSLGGFLCCSLNKFKLHMMLIQGGSFSSLYYGWCDWVSFNLSTDAFPSKDYSSFATFVSKSCKILKWLALDFSLTPQSHAISTLWSSHRGRLLLPFTRCNNTCKVLPDNNILLPPRNRPTTLSIFYIWGLATLATLTVGCISALFAKCAKFGCDS